MCYGYICYLFFLIYGWFDKYNFFDERVKKNFYFNLVDIFFLCVVYRCDIYWLKYNGFEIFVYVLLDCEYNCVY